MVEERRPRRRRAISQNLSKMRVKLRFKTNITNRER
jgi:hypothetical protein